MTGVALKLNGLDFISDGLILSVSWSILTNSIRNKMKKAVVLLIICTVFNSVFGQAIETKNTFKNKYKINNNDAHQDTAYYQIGAKRDTLKAGWTIIETRGGIQIQRVLSKDTIIVSKIDSIVGITSNWKVSEVKHTNDAPDKLFINPFNFQDTSLSWRNAKFFLKIPENRQIVLMHTFFTWSAITIPFAVRPSLNDTIGNKITTDLKVGASFSFNYNREAFKNRRIEAKRSTKGISMGIGFGFSKVTLDKSSTSLSKEPYKESEDGLALFVNPGIGVNLRGFQVALFYGWDIGLTENVDDWNYNKKPYWGIGLGIDLSTFGK